MLYNSFYTIHFLFSEEWIHYFKDNRIMYHLPDEDYKYNPTNGETKNYFILRQRLFKTIELVFDKSTAVCMSFYTSAQYILVCCC